MVDANHTCFEQGAPGVFNGNNISEYIINLFRVSFVIGILLEHVLTMWQTKLLHLCTGFRFLDIIGSANLTD